MKLREKGKSDAEVVDMGWDEAQAALLSGAYDVIGDDGKVVETEGAGAIEKDGDAKKRPSEKPSGKLAESPPAKELAGKEPSRP